METDVEDVGHFALVVHGAPEVDGLAPDPEMARLWRRRGLLLALEMRALSREDGYRTPVMILICGSARSVTPVRQ